MLGPLEGSPVYLGFCGAHFQEQVAADLTLNERATLARTGYLTIQLHDTNTHERVGWEQIHLLRKGDRHDVP